MTSLRCPQCKLVNFADAFVCKRCNYQLQNYPQPTQNYGGYNQTAAPNLSNYPSSSNAQSVSTSNSSSGLRKMLIGALFAVGGTIATVASYGSAGGGGRYFIFWGAILFGAIDFLRGLSDWMSGKD